MLQKNKMALESLWFGTADIIENVKIKKPNGSTSFEKKTVLQGIKCRLSSSSATATSNTETVSNISKVIKLFLSNEYSIKEGSIIVVTQNGITQRYKSSGVPSVYTNHQEIILTLEDKYS